MCGNTIKYTIRKDHILERFRVTPISNKMVENHLRWFGHVKRRPSDTPVRRADQTT